MSHFTPGHALLIGVGADLPNTITDATGLAALLQDPERCAYPAAQVQVLTGEQATRLAILAALDQLAAQTGSDATVLFYFSGHGYKIGTLTGKAYFLMPYGYAVNDLSTTAISGGEFMTKLKAIPAQKMLILLDCCHAGGLDDAKAPGAIFAKAPLPPEAQELLAQGRGRVIIASSQANELSYVSQPYSQFTQALVEALAGAGASTQDGYVRAADLALYARETVPSHTGNRQHPVLHFEQADNFVVAYYAAGAKQPKTLPPAAQRQATAAPASPTTHPAITNRGSGAIAHGPGATAAGERGVAIGGNVTDATIITGDGNTTQQAKGSHIAQAAHGSTATVNDHSSRSVFDQRGQTVHGGQTNIAGNVDTGGGFFNTGTINTGGGTLAGRDQIGSGLSAPQLAQLITPILNAVQTAPASVHQSAVEKTQALQSELAKGNQANDSLLADLIQDLIGLVPSAVSAIVSAFTSPLLTGIIGPITQHILQRLGMR